MINKKYLTPIYLLLLFSACVTEKGEVSVKLPGVKTFKDSQIYNATVTNIQIINNQLVITGNNLNIITNIKTENTSKTFMKDFVIESKSNSQIIANSTSPISFAANELFKLVISNSYGAASFDISFNLCNSTLNGRALDCTVVANDRDVLSYDATSQTWKPRAVNGLNYLGSFDASSGTAPTAQPSGSYYIISVAGTISGINFEVGDWIVSNGTAYQKIDNSTAITSVFGRTGAVVALEGDYSLDQLLDVDLTVAPVAGKVLKYDGTKWVASDDLSGGGAGSVSSTEIADGSIATTDIANLAVTDAKINDVAAGKISGTLTGTQIGAGVITNSHIAAGAAIDYSKLNIPNTSIPYAKLNIAAGEIPQDRINGLSTSLSALIEDAINDAMTTKAPSQNAVFDALGLKADRTGVAQTITALAVTGLGAPVANSDATNKQYVDNAISTVTTSANGKVTKTGDTMSGDLTLETNLLLKGGSNFVTVRANAATSNYTLSLPTTAGTNGYVLQTDGTGVLSWINPSTMSAGSSTVNSAAITDGSIVDTDISASANIAQSKIAGLTTDLSNKQPLDAGLTNLSSYNTNGFLVQTADNTFVGRQILGTLNRVNVSNSDGNSGNVQIDVNTSLLPNPVTAGHFLKATGANTSAWSALTSGEVTTALGFTPINKAGDAISTGTISFDAIGTLALTYTPTNLTDATSKSYVDNAIATASNSWAAASGNVYRSTGSVGIGTSTPGMIAGSDTYLTIAKQLGKASLELYSSGNYAQGTDIGKIDFISRTTIPSDVNVARIASQVGSNTTRSQLAFSTRGTSGTLTQKMLIHEDGNVGIGTNTPGQKLEVAGGIKVSYGEPTAPNVSASGLSFDGDTGVFAAADGQLNLWSNNVRTLSLWNSNVGIGETSPANKLTVKSSGLSTTPLNIINSANTNSLFRVIENGSGNGSLFVQDATATYAAYMGADSNMPWIGSSTNHDLRIVTNAVEKMRITNSGNVGIGNSTPTRKLDVVGQGNFETTSAVVMQVTGLGTGYADATNGVVNFYSENNVGSGGNVLKVGSAFAPGTFVVKDNGRTGLGTNDPITKLEVSTTGGPTITVKDNDNLVADDALQTYVQGVDSANTVNWYVGEGSSGKLVGLMASNANYRLFLGTNGVERLSVTDVGNVGIGTNSPDYPLTVNGNVTVGIDKAVGTLGLGNILYFRGTENSTDSFYMAKYVASTDVSALRMNIGDETSDYFVVGSSPGGTFSDRFWVKSDGSGWIAGTLTQASDKRLKKNIVSLDNSLEKLLSLDGVYYDWISKDMDQEKQIGLIAQDVQKVFPEAVKTNQKGFLSVSYSNLIAPVIESIKEIYNNHIVKLWDDQKRQDRAIASIKEENKKLNQDNMKLKNENEMIKSYLCQKDPKAPFCLKK